MATNTNYFPTSFQEYIHLSRYSRWLPDKNRRETWAETVDRYFNFFDEYLKENNNFTLDSRVRKELQDAVMNLEVMPSMRCLMTAGEALKRENMAAYNCSYIAIDNPRSFDEILYILMNGTGVGFSVESKNVDQLPVVAEDFHTTDTVIMVADSKLGWAKALREMIGLLYQGQIPQWDVSKVRPAGAPLKTFGGRASGPAPLVDLFKFCVATFKRAAGRKLTTLESHDLVCKIAEIVVVGGVRRCLPEGTLVTTKRGLVPIENVSVGDLVLSDNNKYRKVLATENVGKKKTLKIKTRAGTIVCTPEHRLAVLSNAETGEFIWKNAADVLPEDCLIYNGQSVDTFDSDATLEYVYDKPKHSTNCKNIDISLLSNEEWAWLIGQTHGDGYVSKKNVTYAVSRDMPETKEKIVSFASRLNLKYEIRDYDGYSNIRVFSRQLAEFLSKYKKPKTNIDVPDFVLSGNKTTRVSYLAGLFDADGSAKVKREGRKVLQIVCTVYENFHKQVCAVLASLGIPYTVKEFVPTKKNWQKKYYIYVVGSYHKDDLAYDMKPFSEKIRNDYNFNVCKVEQNTVVLNKVLVKESSIAQNFDSPYKTSSSKNVFLPWAKFASAKTWFMPAMVKSVEVASEEICHDLQVEDTESFFAGGFLVHNSALISLSDLSDDRMRTAKSGAWWEDNVQRALANNSFVAKDQIDVGVFMKEWLSLYESKSGERGIFSRKASKAQAEKFGRRDPNHDFGTNPCCLVGDTNIITREYGEITLKEIVDMFDSVQEIDVLGFNKMTGESEFYPIESVKLTRPNAEVLRLTIADESGEKVVLKITPDHLVWTNNMGYIRADQITEQDELLINKKNGTVKGKLISMESFENEDTYDIQTESQNFFANGILVHNSEIILRSRGVCNLTEVVVRETDTPESLARKVRLATILGTIQSTLVNFKYVSKKWRENCEDERLLGVSLTGIMDNGYTNGKLCKTAGTTLETMLESLREEAVKVNKEWTEKIGIKQSAAITCVKPSGTVSQLVDSASGIHARHNPYYVRTVRADKKDPLAKMMIDMGFPVEDDVTKPDHTYVFSFPMKAPENAVYRYDLTAIEQLELWLTYQRHWCEHKPSVTVSVKEHEWPEVGAWVWKHFDEMSGVSFLPFSDHVYAQAPYQDCTKEEYEALLAKMPKSVDWSKLSDYEKSDHTESTQTLACTAGGCDLL